MRHGTQGGNYGNHISPWRAPLCSFELYPLFWFAEKLSRRLEWGKAWWYGKSISEYRNSVNLRFVADYRNWLFFGLVFLAYFNPTAHKIAFSWPFIATIVVLGYFHRYPAFWLSITSGKVPIFDSESTY